MPLTGSVADAIGVVTIILVSVLTIIGFLCIAYSFFFLSRTRNQGFVRLSYFTGPWIVRITLVLITIWWGLGEIVRLDFLRREGRVLNSLTSKWQENICKGYIVSNLGFAEPCLLLTLVFLLRAPLQKMEFGSLGQKWNGKIAGYVILCCLPMFVLQLVVILMGPRLDKHMNSTRKLPHYFTSTSLKAKGSDNIELCTYPLLSTILLGLFVTILTVYLFWLGRRILNMVINKGLEKRIYRLIFSVSGFIPLRVLLLGLSVLSQPEGVLFEALAFMAFLALLCCAGMCICMLVYCPVADSLALGSVRDLEARMRMNLDRNDETLSLIANQGIVEESDSSTKRGSVSFRSMGRVETSAENFVELSLFSSGRRGTSPGSPRFLH